MAATRLSNRLEELVALGRFTQREVAEGAGVTQQTVSRWVTGDVRPPVERLGALERLLGAEPGELVRLASGEAPAPDVPAHGAVSPSGLHLPSDLTPDEAGALQEYVDLLVRARRR